MGIRRTLHDDGVLRNFIDPLHDDGAIIGDAIEDRIRAMRDTMADRDNPYVPLRLDDIAQVVGEVIKAERKKILEHVNRLHQLSKSDRQAAAGRDVDLRVRIDALFRRVTALESEFRRYRKSGALPRSPDPDLTVRSR